jgi:hypothetical protein
VCPALSTFHDLIKMRKMFMSYDIHIVEWSKSHVVKRFNHNTKRRNKNSFLLMNGNIIFHQESKWSFLRPQPSRLPQVSARWLVCACERMCVIQMFGGVVIDYKWAKIYIW